MEVPSEADVGGQVGGVRKRGARIKLWHWIVIIGFAALATDIALRLRSVPKVGIVRQPTAAELQAELQAQAEMQEFDALIKDCENMYRDSANVDDPFRPLESTQKTLKNLQETPTTPDGNGVIIQL
jgi:hypothetical protein